MEGRNFEVFFKCVIYQEKDFFLIKKNMEIFFLGFVSDICHLLLGSAVSTGRFGPAIRGGILRKRSDLVSFCSRTGASFSLVANLMAVLRNRRGCKGLTLTCLLNRSLNLGES